MSNITNKTRIAGISQFMYKLLLLFLILVTVDFMVGELIHFAFSRQKSGALYRTGYSMDSTTADILIFGSSTANHSYDTKIFRNGIPGQTTYNCGNAGSSIFYHYSVLSSVLKRYTPKIIILDFVSGEFRYVLRHYDKLSYLLPFLKNHEDIQPIINLKSPFEKFKLVSNTYPYNSLLLSIMGGVFNIHSTNRVEDNGYVALEGVWNSEIKVDSIKHDYAMDSNKIHYFKEFINICINADTKLIISCSPSYKIKQHEDISLKLGKSISGMKGVEFIDFSNDTSFTNHRQLFRDVAHLNKKGAEKFSEIFVSKIMSDNQLNK